MANIYKVTSAKIAKTKRGFSIYELWLNNTIKATKLMPTRESHKSFDNLYQFFIENGSLYPLRGKYISLDIYNTSYGLEFSRIISFDVIEDFKEMLDSAGGKSFSCQYDMYSFLKKRNYTINQDDSITLKPPYDRYNILGAGGATLCIPNNLGESHVDLNNIKIIYENFYKGKDPNPSNLDVESEYGLGLNSIYCSSKKYHKNLSKVISRHTSDVLRVGDLIQEEHIEFLKKKK